MKENRLQGSTLRYRRGTEGVKDVSLTVYNNDLALVREKTTMPVDRGVSEIRYRDVAALIDPTSVSFRSLTAPGDVTILEQNYRYDLLNLDKLLLRYLEKEVTLLTKEQKNHYDGALLSFDPGQITLRDSMNGGLTVVQRSEIQDLRFSSLPEGLITRPTLVWKLKAKRAAEHGVELSYLTAGFDWHAEYIAGVDPDEKKISLSGWVSLENTSGTTFHDARLKLVAGDVHRVEEKGPVYPPKRFMQAAMDEAGQFEEREFFEYHLYDLKGRTTLADREIKQVSLFAPVSVAVKKIFSLDSTKEQKVRVMLEFENSSKYNLGIPLPKGKIRVYKEDVDGSSEFIGEDRIDHTPKEEKVKIYLGNAFDIVAERSVQDTRKISSHSREETIEVKLGNRKKEDVTVTVTEKLWGDWRILESTHAFDKVDAFTVEFELPVPKGGETVLTYRARRVF